MINQDKQSQEKQKALAGKKAAEIAAKIIKGMPQPVYLGLGTGSTVRYFIEEMAKLKMEGKVDFIGVPTSNQTEELAKKLGIPLERDYNKVPNFKLPVYVDGADEIRESSFEMIKGGGGAMLREEIVAEMAEHIIIVADPTKMVRELGKFPLPVEVLKMNYEILLEKFQGNGWSPKIRERDGKIFETDNGNLIIDLSLGKIADPVMMKRDIKAMLGVVAVGLFVENNRPDIVVIGDKVIER